VATDAFGCEIDYAQIVKLYGNEAGPGQKHVETRIVPPRQLETC